MKKMLLMAVTVTALAPAFAQEMVSRGYVPGNEVKISVAKATEEISHLDANKSTGLTDTLYFRSDSMYVGSARALYADYAAPLDSGLFYGTNALGVKGAAQLWFTDFDASNNNDTTVQFLGWYTKWAGHIQSSSTKQITMQVWDRGTNKVTVPGRSKFFVYGTPSTSKFSRSVNANSLTTTGAANLIFLATPATVTYDIYAGYTQTYTWGSLAGDTLAPRSTLGGYSNTASIETSTGDTLVNARTLLQDKNGTWQSVIYNLGVTNGGDVIIAPIFKMSCPKCGVGVGGVRRGDLSFFGNYPNPASSITNVKFALANTTKVTCTIYDNTARKLSVMELGQLSAGEHAIPVSVAQLSAGNYVCVLETANGDIMASQLSVVK